MSIAIPIVRKMLKGLRDYKKEKSTMTERMIENRIKKLTELEEQITR